VLLTGIEPGSCDQGVIKYRLFTKFDSSLGFRGLICRLTGFAHKKNREENFVLYVYLRLYYMAVSLFIATPLLLRPRPRPTAAAPA
jgi:hypothetical protein